MFDTRLSEAKERWLADLYEANADAVFRLCARMLANPQDAADACHEIFIRAADKLPQSPSPLAGEGQGGGAERGWLLTVARNYCLDQIRRSKSFDRALTRFGSESQDETDPETEVVNRHTIDGIFKQLNERERTVLWQTAVEHRPLNEIAGRLHLSYMAAGQVVSRARKRAFTLAAKVAAVFGIFRLITRRIGVMPVKLVAAAAVPVVALTVQPSSSSMSPPDRVVVAGVSSSTTHGSPARPSAIQPRVSPGNSSSLPLSLPTATPALKAPIPLPSAVNGTVNTASGTLNPLLHAVPTPPAPPVLPSIALPTPPALPSPSVLGR